MSARSVQAFLPLEPPTVTHNSLEAYVIRRNGRAAARIRKSDRLKEAEGAIMAALAMCVPDSPLTGPLRVQVRLCFEPVGDHADGEPHAARPDLDNFLKSFLDCLTRSGVIADDRMVCDLRASKAWASPAGIWVRVERLTRP